MAVWIGRWERRRENSIVSTWIRGSRLFLRSLVGEALNEIFKAQTAERKSDVHRPQRPQRKPSSSTDGRINVGVLCSAKHTYVQVCAYYINMSGGGEDARLPSQRPLTETFFKHLKAWNHWILLRRQDILQPYLWEQNWIFWMRCWDINSRVCCNKIE